MPVAKLTKCLGKAGKSFSAEEGDLLQRIADEYIADGQTGIEAARSAVTDMLEVYRENVAAAEGAQGIESTVAPAAESAPTKQKPATGERQMPVSPPKEVAPRGKTDSAGRNATESKQETAPKGEAEIASSRAKIAAQTKLIRDLTAGAKKLAERNPAKAKPVFDRIAQEQEKLAQMLAAKRSGTAPTVGTLPNGEPDLLTDIAEHVGLLQTQPKEGRAVGGELDGAVETLGQGAARLLRGGKDGVAWDEAVEIINAETGRNFQSVGDFQQAITNAVAQRRQLGEAFKTEEYKGAVEAAALTNEGRGFATKPKAGVPIEKIGVGGKFEIRGEKFSVVDIDEGEGGQVLYVIKDGHKFMVPEGTMFFADRGTLKKGKAEQVAPYEDPLAADTLGAPKKDHTRDMFDEGLADEQFTLNGGTAEDATGVVDAEEARRVAKAKADAAQGNLFGAPADSRTKTPEFVRWFGNSKVVDANGDPLVVYHGSKRADRIDSRFRKTRATSGPMAFFTDDPAIASNYATGKEDTSLETPADYSGWFKFKAKGMRSPVSIDRAWWLLTPEQRQQITQRIYTTGYENADMGEGPIVGNSSSIMGRDSIDYELRQARGNGLRALVEIWLNSGSLFNDERTFLDVLSAVGMDMGNVEFDSPWATRSGVFPVYLSIQNPLNTGAIPANVVETLREAGKRKRAKQAAGGNADMWDKNTISGRDWLETFNENISTGSSTAWTRIPDWVTDSLRGLGYDGIQDTGGKMGGDKHTVWIPFEETQVKSATGNSGEFDPENPSILGAPVDTPAILSADEINDPEAAQATARTLRQAARVASGVSGAVSASQSGRLPSLREQEEALKEWAGSAGLMIEPTAFAAEWRKQGSQGGAENQVYFDDASQRVVKRNALLFNDDWVSFFRRVMAHNRLFPDTAYLFHGFTPMDDTQPDIASKKVTIQAVLSQPVVRGEGANYDEIGEALVARGFEEGLSGQFEDERFIIDDLGPNNVLKDEAGNIRFIDPQVMAKPGIVLGAPAEQDAPVFYSRLTRTVEQSPQAKASGAQWKATIRNSKLGVNQDEFALAGVGDLEDGKTYTKQEVLDYLKANEVKVEDVTLGAISDADVLAAQKRLEDAGYTTDWDIGDEQAMILKGEDEVSIDDLPPELQKDARTWARDGKKPHFGEYVLPGATEGSYREVLLTVRGAAQFDPAKVEIQRNRQSVTQGTVSLKYDGENMGTWSDDGTVDQNWMKPEKDLIEMVKRLRERGDRFGNYQAPGNWRDGHSQYDDIANPIVRLRLNERTTADGKRMLFLEEVQAPQKSEFAKMPTLFQKNWREIAFKWALRKAAEGGYDSLGWTTGTQQAERYDLSKQVRHIDYQDVGDGIKFVGVSLQGGDGGFSMNVKDGKVLESRKGADQFVGRGLDEVIGKDAAKQILEGKQGRLEAADLKVGGEGLRQLYDRDFRNVVNGLPVVKRSGQKVGTAQIVTGKERRFESEGSPSLDEIKSVVARRRAAWDDPASRTAEGWSNWNVTLDQQASGVIKAMEMGAPFKGAMAAYASSALAAVLGGKFYNENNTGVIHSLAITPDMRAAAMDGQTLGSPPESINPPKNAEVPGQPGYRYRSHPDTLIERGLDAIRQVYKTQDNATTAKAAKAFLDNLKDDAAAVAAANDDTNTMPGAVRTAVKLLVEQKLVAIWTDPKADPKVRADARRKWDRLVESVAERGTDLGQEIQAFDMANRITPDGVLLAAGKAVKARQEKIIGEDGKKAVDEAADALQKENEKAIDEATADMNAALRAVKVGKSIWQRYRDSAVKRWISSIENATGQQPAEPPPLVEFTNRLVREVQARIDDTLPKGEPRPPRTPAEIIREAVDNRAKYKEAWDAAREQLGTKYADRPDVLEKLDEAMMGLLDRPYSDKTLDRAIKEAHKEMGETVRDLARMHYRQADALGQTLAEKIAKQAGLKPEDAERLANLVKLRMAKLTAEAKKKVLARLIEGKNGRSRRIFGAADRIIELSNLGALTKDEYFDAVAKELDLPGLSDKQATKLRELAEKAQAAPEGFQRDRVLTDLLTELLKVKGIGTVDVATAVYYAHILSGYTTQMVNAVSTAMNTAADVAVMIARRPTTAAQAIRGIRDGARTGFVQAMSILDTGYAHRSFDEKMPEVAPILEALAKDTDRNAALRAYAKALRYVSRGMKAMDSIFFQSAAEAYQRVAAARLAAEFEGGKLNWQQRSQKVRDLLAMSPAEFEAARVQAKAEGMTGLDYQLRVGEILRQKRDAGLVERGVAFGREATFNQAPRGYLGVAAKAIRDASNKFPPLRLFVPFTNVVANVANASLNYSPVGAVRAVRGYGGEGAPSTTEERDALLMKGIAGSMGLIFLLAYGMGDDDEETPWITGTGPQDTAARNQLRKTGWKPNTVKIGNAYVSYLETPLAIPLAIVGSYIDGVKYNGLDHKAAGERLAKAIATVPETIVSMSFLRGLADFMDAVRGRKDWGEIGSGVVAGATVPNLVRQIDRTFDPTLRETNGVLGGIAGQIPGVRQTFQPRIDVVGNPIETSPIERFGRPATNDELWDTLAAKQAWIPEAGKATKLGGQTLTPAQYRAYVQLSGPGIETRLRAALPRLKLMTKEQADDFVAKVTREERARVKPQLRAIKFEVD